MVTKNIFGILILILNTAGLGFLVYMGGLALIEHFSPKPAAKTNDKPKKKTIIINDDILPEEDDLLKDMDLSDLDNLNLDDLE